MPAIMSPTRKQLRLDDRIGDYVKFKAKCELARRNFYDFCIAKNEWFYKDRDYLKEICDSIQEFENDDNELLIINAPPRFGKKIKHDTPVLTMNGWKNHGDLQIGDYVINLDGEFVKVINVLPKTLDKDYIVKFSNGEEIIAHANHEWVVHDRDKKRIVVVETKYMMNKLEKGGTEHIRGHRYRFQLPLVKPLQSFNKELPIHPYVLGAWLGDGYTRNTGICACDKDIIVLEECAKYYSVMRKTKHKITGVNYWYFDNRKKMQELGMCYTKKRIEKHIPESYLTASLNQRLELLAGLLDTDGSLRQKENRYVFSTSDEKLRDDFISLVSTFGWRACLTSIEPRISTSGIHGKKVVWGISFNPTMYIPCRIERKQLKNFSKQRKISIVSIEQMEKETIGNCISVEGGVYLVGRTLIPTHNSFTATNATQWLLGRNPKYKIMTCSYNETLSMKFSKQVRNGIQESYVNHNFQHITFRDVFPKTKIKRGSSAVQMWTIDGNSEENYLATSPNATTTGIGADFIIIDDIVKNKYEACNADILEKHWEWFTDTLYSRLEGKRKIIVIMTRWATKDLAGRLIKMFEEQNRKYKLITFKACDNGKMLNNDILNEKQYKNLIQTIGEDIVRANYDQEPIDLKGVLYENLQEYDFSEMEQEQIPKFNKILSKCDTADTGEDYLCNIIYGETADKKKYILDVYYTQDSMEITEEEVAKRLTQYRVQYYYPESNNGGRGFSRSVERRCRELGNNFTIFKPYTQTLNKKARILSNATTVQLSILFPKGWNKLYPEFYRAVTEYQRTGKNAHDDAPDCLTSLVESNFKSGSIKFA